MGSGDAIVGSRVTIEKIGILKTVCLPSRACVALVMPSSRIAREKVIPVTSNKRTTKAEKRNEPTLLHSLAYLMMGEPDGWDARTRIGILMPHFDLGPEAEFGAMAPDGVAIHSTASGLM